MFIPTIVFTSNTIIVSRALKEAKVMFDRNETAANTKTRPRGLAKQIWGGEAGLAEAIRKEEAWENENGTISWYEEDQKHIRGELHRLEAD